MEFEANSSNNEEEEMKESENNRRMSTLFESLSRRGTAKAGSLR
jgi:hypothetical protein